jgi:hypothetical protein
MTHRSYDLCASWNNPRCYRPGLFFGEPAVSHRLSFLLPDGPKPHNKRLGQSSKNQHSPQTSVRELSFHLQRHQFRNEPRECVQTQIIPTFSTTRVQPQPHHLARAASGHSMAWVVLSRSSRGGGSEGMICVLCIVYNLFLVSYSFCFALEEEEVTFGQLRYNNMLMLPTTRAYSITLTMHS